MAANTRKQLALWNAHDEAGGYLGRIRSEIERKPLALARARKKFPLTAFVVELVSMTRMGFRKGADGVWRTPQRRHQ